MKNRLYTDDRIPHVANVGVYAATWISWWSACQPPWRQSEEWPLSREAPDHAKWGKLTARGQNGVFLLVMSTTWWAFALKSSDDRRVFDEAMDDLRWVIEKILRQPSTPADPTQNRTPDPLQVANAPIATWMSRKEGKRRPKPSRALLESIG